MENEVLRAIRERRSIYKFKPGPVEEDKVHAILEAGRWAPSWTNTQPCEFIVVEGYVAKKSICDVAKVTLRHDDIEEASVIIVICADPGRDPTHFIEDGAVATQNMALAAHSLGLASYWLGVFDLRNQKGSVEDKVKSLLGIPKEIRVIALLPLGVPAYSAPGWRNWLRRMVHFERYGNKRLLPVEPFEIPGSS